MNARVFPWMAGMVLLASLSAAASEDRLPLDGEWGFRMDPQDQGLDEAWYAGDFAEKILLPGSMNENGYGDEVTPETPWMGTVMSRMWHEDPRFARFREPGHVKILFWLQPDKYYAGPAWYRRDIEVPASFQGKQVSLHLERCHWETRLWLDGAEIGRRDSLSVPHEYDLGTALSPGKHTLVLRIDNRLLVDVGINAHSVSDNTQTNWNGIVGDMALVARDAVQVMDVQVYPDVAAHAARVVAEVRSCLSAAVEGVLRLQAASWNTGAPHEVPAMEMPFRTQDGVARVEAVYPLGEDAPLWSPHAPAMHTLRVTCTTQDGATHTRTADFGLREIATDGTQFTVNGQRIFLRGTLECCIFPRTGYPPTDVESWLRELEAARDHGLNHLRFHSWCPPEAAFQAADRMGFLFHVEGPFWCHFGDGDPIDKYIYTECDRMLQAYGNHPSFALMAYGNEPNGKNSAKFLADLVTYWKEKDPRRLYTGAAGWPKNPENQYHVIPDIRVHSNYGGKGVRFSAEPFESRMDYGDWIANYSVPMVSHEIGQWCVFPNLDERVKYTGPIKAKNFDIVEALLEDNGIRDQARDFFLASGKLQVICYKEEIESALRSPGMGGFQLLDLHDFPGQGTALVGMIDPFWESKDYMTPKEFRRFCSDTVPLLRMDSCIYTADQTFTADAEISHYGPEPLHGVRAHWRILDEQQRVHAEGVFQARDIPLGSATSLGRISLALDSVPAPAHLKVEVFLPNTEVANDWDLWVYPPAVEVDPTEDVYITETLDADAAARLNAGGKVLLLPAKGAAAGDEFGPVPPGFPPVFWNTFWFPQQKLRTLGLLCQPEHPALADFPTQFHSNWQWRDLVHDSPVMILTKLPQALRPIVQVVDDWNTSRKLGLVFEAKVGEGKLLVCSADIRENLEARPVARQLRHSLLRYMASDLFAPQIEVDLETVSGLFREVSALRKHNTAVRADGYHIGMDAALAMDGNPSTFWHTPYGDETPGYPHWIRFEFQEPLTFTGFSMLPRQDMNNGRIGAYAVYVSNDKDEWGEPVHRGSFDGGPEWKKVTFDTPHQGRFFRLDALKPAVKGQPWTTIAEMDIAVEE